MSDSAFAAIGHNNPPSDIDIMGERIRELYPDLLNRAEQHTALADSVIPEEINDEETAGKIGDYIKQITVSMKNLDAARTAEKEPHLAKGRAVDGFFKRYTEKLDAIKKRAAIPAAAYKDRRDAEDRRRREEEARRQREEAEAKIREAERLRQEAEQRRREEQEAREKAEREAQAERERIQREHEEAQRKQQEEIDRQRKAREEAEAKVREAKLQKERDDEALKKAQEEAAAAKQAQREAEERQKELDRQKREQERQLREDERIREQQAKELAKDARQAERESDKLLDESMRHDKAADKMDRAALNTNNRIRGEEGSLLTTRKVWVGQLQDRHLLDLEALRQHLPEDALHKAIQSFVDAGGRKLDGAHIFEDTTVLVR